MDVSIIGSGYVGTTIAACLADDGYSVVNVDIDSEPIDAINRGESPIHEPGLNDLIATHAGANLR
jgi:UDPglucose 6-dehydrogenase